MGKDLIKIVENLNKKFDTDFNSDSLEPLLKITLKNMEDGKSFDESFKLAINSMINSYHRLAKGTKRRELAEKIIFERLYQ